MLMFLYVIKPELEGEMFFVVYHVYLFDIAMFDHPSVELTNDWWNTHIYIYREREREFLRLKWVSVLTVLLEIHSYKNMYIDV